MFTIFRFSLATLLSTMLLVPRPGMGQTVDWKPYFTLDPDEGTRFVYDTTAIERNAGVPKLLIAPDGRPVLAYIVGPEPRTTILEENGETIRPVADLANPQRGDGGFIYLPDGRIRYVTEEPSPDNTPQKHRSRIISFISPDGLEWAREPGIRYQPGSADDSIASVPAVLQVADSIWRMYYVGDFYRDNGVRTALSYDWGTSWRAESNGNILRRGDVDPHPVYLRDGRIRLYHRSGFVRSERADPSHTGIAYTDSPDGLTFDTLSTRVVISDTVADGAAKLDPAVIRFPNGDVACFIGASFPNDPMRSKLVVARSARESRVGDESDEGFEGLMLDPPVPNPTTGGGTVSFTLPTAGRVSLKIFDTAGREVETLIDGWCPAGRSVRSFRGDRLTDGVYAILLVQDRGRRLQIVSVVR